MESDVDVSFDDVVSGDVMDRGGVVLDPRDFGMMGVSGVDFSGVYKFGVGRVWLREVAEILRSMLVMGSKGGVFRGCKVVLMRDWVTFCYFGGSGFSEHVVPVDGEVEGDIGDGCIEFVVDPALLIRVAGVFVSDVIRFEVDAGVSVLSLCEGRTRVEAQVYGLKDFVDYRSKLVSPSVVCDKVDSVLLADSINYNSVFYRKSESVPFLMIQEIRDGYSIGGSFQSIGVFRSDGLDGVRVSFKNETSGVVERVLRRFDSLRTVLFETEDYYMLRDGILTLGLERPRVSFPDVRSLTDKDEEISVVVSRPLLISALRKVSVTSVSQDDRCELVFSGVEDKGTMLLRVKDRAGRVSEDSLDVFRTSVGGAEVVDRTCFVNLNSLLGVVSRYNSPLIRFGTEGTEKVLIIRDGCDRFDVKSILVSMTRDQVERIERERAVPVDVE